MADSLNDHGLLLDGLCVRRLRHYITLADREDWARKYLLGWCNRTMALRDAAGGA